MTRARLLDLLETGAQGPLTLLAAPPGAGKTMLLASWVAGRAPADRVVWVTVDPGDDDPSRFWAHVLAGLRESAAVPAGGLLAGLDPPGGTDPSDEFLSLVVNGLSELTEPVVLVLDDLHEASGTAVSAGLRFLLRHNPPQLRLVVATRADPALALHRQRVAGQLTEIRATDLAFTQEEARELFGGLGVELADDGLRSVWERTEGWAAGLRLAAMSLRDHPDPGRFVADFAGDDRVVAGYLVEEVLARQSPEVQRFLLFTCVVERLCGGLADALTGRTDGERMLARLEHDHAFTAGLGPGRSWYRYHPLFAELLEAELRHGWPGEVPGLHRRAAAWYAANGMVADAVRHALAGGDEEGAAGLLAAHWLALFADGQVAALTDLLGLLPAARVRGDQELAVAAAMSQLELRGLRDVDAWLGPAGSPDSPEPAMARLLRARLDGDADRAMPAALELLVPELAGDPQQASGAEDRRALVLWLLGTAELWDARLDDAVSHLEESRALAERAGRDYLVFTVTAALALLEAVRGRPTHATLLGAAAAELAARRAWWQNPPAAYAGLALACAAAQRDDGASSSVDLELAAQVADAGCDRPLALAVALVEAWLAGAGAGEHAALGLARLREALAAAPGWRLPRLLASAAGPTEARLLAAVGEHAAADALLSAHPGGARTAPSMLAALGRGDPEGATGELAAGGYLAGLGTFTPHPGPPLLEPLSEREQVVLRYLPSMLSTGEIAAELYLSVNTVKTHLKSIYRKLDTNRRWDTVRRARQLELL